MQTLYSLLFTLTSKNIGKLASIGQTFVYNCMSYKITASNVRLMMQLTMLTNTSSDSLLKTLVKLKKQTKKPNKAPKALLTIHVEKIS